MASSQTEDNMLESSENSFMLDDRSDFNNSQSSDEEVSSVEKETKYCHPKGQHEHFVAVFETTKHKSDDRQ
eukprot:scaffold6419_cov116-Cylindrotheca_fusiformis.AAC.6